MVNLVENWEVIEDHAGDKQGYYQILGNDVPIEIRVHVGLIGFKREFKTKDDSLLGRILDFCKTKAYIKISQAVRDELFFK